MRSLFVFLLSLGLAWTQEVPGRTRYDGQQVLRCKIDPAAPMEKILISLDVWGTFEDNIDVRAKTANERAMLESLLDCTVLVEDLESMIQQGEAENIAARAEAGNAPDRWFESYHTLAELNTYYRDLVTAPNSFVTSQTIGTTANGNNIVIYTMNPAKLTAGPIVFLDAGIHAREWIAPATLNYIIDNLITQYNAGNTTIRNLLNRCRIVFNPLINPDGYAYTWTNDRLWRKNRARYNSTCLGTDCNRNFNTHWGQGGSSTNPCDETYMGPSVASEREVSTTQSFVLNLLQSGPIYAYVSYHSYSQLILRPWGWTSANSPNETYLKTLGDTMQTQIQAFYGRTYRSQKSNALYITTGSSSDWFYDDTVTNANRYNNVNYRVASYTIELRPQENNRTVGFQLPPAEIIPTGIENYTPLLNLLTSVLNNPVLKTN